MQSVSLGILFAGLLLFLPNPAESRQVSGRPTLPSDCTTAESFVSNFNKSTGAVTAFCRRNREGYHFWASRFKAGGPKDWPLKKEHARPWKSEEQLNVLRSLMELPEQLWSQNLIGIFECKNRSPPTIQRRPAAETYFCTTTPFRSALTLPESWRTNLHMNYIEIWLNPIALTFVLPPIGVWLSRRTAVKESLWREGAVMSGPMGKTLQARTSLIISTTFYLTQRLFRNVHQMPMRG